MSFPIHLNEVLIGRVAGNDLVIADPSVAARHARLRLSGGVWSLADLGSVNGTTVDGNPVLREQALAPGSELTLGTSTLYFEPLDRWEDAVAPAGPVALPESEPEEPPSRWPMYVGVTILVVSLVGYLLTRVG